MQPKTCNSKETEMKELQTNEINKQTMNWTATEDKDMAQSKGSNFVISFTLSPLQ